MLNINKETLKTKIEIFTQFIVIGVIISVLFKLNSAYILWFSVGMVFISILYKSKLKTYIAIAFATLISYILQSNAPMIGAFLLGINIYGFYLYVRSKSPLLIKSIILINIIGLASTVFPLSIENIRGFNKVNKNDIALAIPLIIIIPFFLKLVMATILEGLKKLKKNKKQIILTMSIILMLSYFALSYYKFKEVGTDKIYIPLLAGIIIYLINMMLDKKYVALNILLTSFLLVIIPYQVTGILGVVLTFLIAYICTSLFDIDNTILNGFIPFMFLLTAIQIREDRGLITEFNLGSGYQLGYLIIALAIITPLLSIIKEIKKIFIENEIPKLISIASVLFTIGLFPIIMKVGKYEALSDLIFATSLLVFSLQLFSAVKIVKVETSKTTTYDLLSFGLLFASLSYFTLILY